MEKKEVKIDFVGIGAPKSATTWVYECTREHPQVRMALKDQGESSFFSTDDFEKRIQGYDLFQKKECKDKLMGAFNVWYLHHPQVAARIREHNEDMKILAVLRDPVQRAYSEYLHYTSLQENKWDSFLEAVQKTDKFTEAGFYYKYLKRYYEVFPEENSLIILTQDIKEDSRQVIRKVYDFLEVDSNFEPPTLGQKVSPTKFKLTKLGKLIHKCIGQPLTKFKAGKRLKKSHPVRQLYFKFTRFYTQGSSKPPMSKAAESYLRELYKDDIEKLEELIGKDLSHWKNEQ